MDTLPLDQELQAALEEWRRASADWRSSMRAPSESRVTDKDLWEATLRRKLKRVRDLEEYIAGLRARIAREAA